MAKGNPAFLLGIGYSDQNKKHYKSWIKKPIIDDIVKWQ